MRIRTILLRWYKSFNVNYEQYPDRVPGISKRPWNSYRPAGIESGDYPFIEIPVEEDITTIVGANESGKSHLISAIIKVITGKDANGEEFSRTDLCHYASIRSKNADLWPNIGLQFIASHEETEAFCGGTKLKAPSSSEERDVTITVVLAPDGKDQAAIVYLDDDQTPHKLNSTALSEARKHFPEVKFIDSNVPIADQISLGALLGAYGDQNHDGKPIYEHSVAQELADYVVGTAVQKKQDANDGFVNKIAEFQGKLRSSQVCGCSDCGLELLLFQKVLGIRVDALQHLYGIRGSERGYAEGLIATWNAEIDKALNLSQYWQQDQDFTLRLDYKQGVLYFEITDKTGCIYTFHERSSGLRYFLSYYIQAKAISASPSPRGAVILMDEPDSFLSIMGQRNLLAIFESLVGSSQGDVATQLVYTTHSPFLINRNFTQRLRLVRKGDAEEGTQYVDKVRIRRYEPVRSALGVECAHTLFMGTTNVLLEGPSDQYLILELIRSFITPDNAGDYLDLNNVVFAPADSAPAVEKLIAASQWGDEPIPTVVVLLDDDQSGHDVRDRITGKVKHCKELVKSDSVVLVSDAVANDRTNHKVITTEDLLPPRLYAEAARRYLRRWYPDEYERNGAAIDKRLSEVDFGKEGLVTAVAALFRESVFENKDRDFDKLGVLQEAVALLDEIKSDSKWADVVAETERRIRSLCQLLRKKIAESERAERQRSGKAAIKRIIGDFLATRANACPVFDLQVLLIERLQKEAKFIGQDAAQLESTLSVLAGRAARLRAAKQERLSGENWKKWVRDIENIRQAPLTWKVEAEPEDGDGQPVSLAQEPSRSTEVPVKV